MSPATATPLSSQELELISLDPDLYGSAVSTDRWLATITTLRSDLTAANRATLAAQESAESNLVALAQTW
jgi:hypothetical protein